MVGKRARSTLTPTPESGVGASEHVSTSAGDEISLDDVIAKLKAAVNGDTPGEEIRPDGEQCLRHVLPLLRRALQHQW